MADLEKLLLRTSRTFALSIPRLPEPLREQVMASYLLLRVADTLEDAFRWDRARRLEALGGFIALLRGEADPFELVDSWRAAPPCDHEGYLSLLEALPTLLAKFAALEPRAREAILRHTLRTAEGMRGYLERTGDDGELRLRDLGDLRGYCYIVAGIVGELLTELFLLGGALEPSAQTLRGKAAPFGEALQLVNILKDADDDAREGRIFLPPAVDRAVVFALARADLAEGRAYVQALQAAGAAAGIVAFCALPVLLAEPTLDRVERFGAGAKIDRAEVEEIGTLLEQALRDGAPIFASAPRRPTRP